MDVCRMLVPTSLDIKISICFSIEYYSNSTPAALSILLFLFVVLFVLSFLISWATRDVEKNTHKWPSDASTCSAAAAAANRQPQQQHKHKPFQTGSTRRVRRRSSARQCVCVHLCSLPNALVFHLYVCVCSSPNRRVAPWTALTLFNWLCSLQNCHSHGKCEREADSLALRLTVIAIAWHRFINWFLLWFSQLVRCGAVCVRSVNERYSQTTHAFLFRLSLSSSSYCSPVLLAIVDIGFGSLVNRDKREGERENKIEI